MFVTTPHPLSPVAASSAVGNFARRDLWDTKWDELAEGGLRTPGAFVELPERRWRQLLGG